MTSKAAQQHSLYLTSDLLSSPLSRISNPCTAPQIFQFPPRQMDPSTLTRVRRPRGTTVASLLHDSKTQSACLIPDYRSLFLESKNLHTSLTPDPKKKFGSVNHYAFINTRLLRLFDTLNVIFPKKKILTHYQNTGTFTTSSTPPSTPQLSSLPSSNNFANPSSQTPHSLLQRRHPLLKPNRKISNANVRFRSWI